MGLGHFTHPSQCRCFFFPPSPFYSGTSLLVFSTGKIQFSTQDKFAENVTLRRIQFPLRAIGVLTTPAMAERGRKEKARRCKWIMRCVDQKLFSFYILERGFTFPVDADANWKLIQWVNLSLIVSVDVWSKRLHRNRRCSSKVIDYAVIPLARNVSVAFISNKFIISHLKENFPLLIRRQINEPQVWLQQFSISHVVSRKLWKNKLIMLVHHPHRILILSRWNEFNWESSRGASTRHRFELNKIERAFAVSETTSARKLSSMKQSTGIRNVDGKLNTCLAFDLLKTVSSWFFFY